ncbi:MAG TPA: hypothetical protein VFR37_24315 [Longimicrobium sp.]|nr:hypothetical protein [Longimicrobium sp.]
MSRPWAVLLGGVAAIGGLVFAIGAAMAPGARGAVGAGVLVACAFQLLVFVIAAAALPGNRLAAYGVGMLGRLLLVVAGALLLVPATGVAAGPFLFSLVSVLFATTLLEPVALAAGERKLKGR